MKRKEPPRPAEWILEHLTSGDRDEALAGDLREELEQDAHHGGMGVKWLPPA